jgi:hypothetical protein
MKKEYNVIVKVKLEKNFFILKFQGEHDLIEKAKLHILDLIEEMDLNDEDNVFVSSFQNQPTFYDSVKNWNLIFNPYFQASIIQSKFKVLVPYPNKNETTNTVVLIGNPMEMDRVKMFILDYINTFYYQKINYLIKNEVKLRVACFQDGKKFNQIGNIQKVVNIICGDVVTVIGNYNCVQQACRDIEAGDEAVVDFLPADPRLKDIINPSINRIVQRTPNLKIKFIKNPRSGYKLSGFKDNVESVKNELLYIISTVNLDEWSISHVQNDFDSKVNILYSF